MSGARILHSAYTGHYGQNGYRMGEPSDTPDLSTLAAIRNLRVEMIRHHEYNIPGLLLPGAVNRQGPLQGGKLLLLE
jgi:hypothetical protein